MTDSGIILQGPEHTCYYPKFPGVADAVAAINATVTRVNEVFETDLAVTFELVANTDEVIFTDPDTDPYSGSLSSKVQNTLTSTIGEENYDLGILFHKTEVFDDVLFLRVEQLVVVGGAVAFELNRSVKLERRVNVQLRQSRATFAARWSHSVSGRCPW